MGFSSYMCAKSKIPIPAFPYANFPPEFSEVVLVLPDDSAIEGTYDGYQNIDNVNVMDSVGAFVTEDMIQPGSDSFDVVSEMTKIVLKSEYEGDTYDELPSSEFDPDQGYFYEESTRKQIYKAHGVKPPKNESISEALKLLIKSKHSK